MESRNVSEFVVLPCVGKKIIRPYIKLSMYHLPACPLPTISHTVCFVCPFQLISRRSVFTAVFLVGSKMGWLPSSTGLSVLALFLQLILLKSI